MEPNNTSATEVLAQDQGIGDLYELANLYPKHTGLPFVVWISYRGGAQHDVRVKVSPGPTVRLIEGNMSGGDMALLAQWVELNRDVLVKYWDGEFDTKDALDALRAVHL